MVSPLCGPAAGCLAFSSLGLLQWAVWGGEGVLSRASLEDSWTRVRESRTSHSLASAPLPRQGEISSVSGQRQDESPKGYMKAERGVRAPRMRFQTPSAIQLWNSLSNSTPGRTESPPPRPSAPTAGENRVLYMDHFRFSHPTCAETRLRGVSQQ